ncbi:MAG: type IV pilin-like G/H family protein [Cyanobacteria bacterium P01_B01_bin.77]
MIIRSRFTKSPTSEKVSGFTLIETLVTVSIIGLLSAIALPSFMGQVNKARETEAKIAVGVLKKSQYIFYLENNRFAENINQLDAFPKDTENYDYSIQADRGLLNGALQLAFSKKKELKSYASVIHLKDGQLEECGLFSMEISDQHADIEIFRFIFDAIANYERYCS